MAKGATTLYEARRAQDGVTALPHSASQRALRIPIGFLIILLAVVIALVVVGYYIGFGAGFDAGTQSKLDASEGVARTVDPLVVVTVPPVKAQSNQSLATSAGTPLAPPPAGDPRQIGLNYIIIADVLPPERASEMVAYCRSQGLDAISIPRHNARSQVIVLPGFGWEDREGAQVKALEAQIRAVGAKWKALGRGNGDFRDFYPKLFKGQS